MTEWIKTHDLTTRCLHFKYKIQQTESKRVEKNQVCKDAFGERFGSERKERGRESILCAGGVKP